MKIVLSRKGFDSAAGGDASPILPDGQMLSLPIPSNDDCRWDDVRANGRQTVGSIVRQLIPTAMKSGGSCHLDPDLDRQSITRLPGWQPSLGQCGAAATHLFNQQVGVGDLLLFFGWFKRAASVRGRLQWADSQGFHALFGYLQIGEIIRPDADSIPEWLKTHPHVQTASLRKAKNNCILIASSQLDLPGEAGSPQRPGAGRFTYHPDLKLTADGATRSVWNLDQPTFGNTVMTYHSEGSWRSDGLFKSAARGQEFVLPADRPIIEWVRERIGCGLDARPEALVP